MAADQRASEHADLAVQALEGRRAAERAATEANEGRRAAETALRTAHESMTEVITGQAREREEAERRMTEMMNRLAEVQEQAAEAVRLRAEAEEVAGQKAIDRQAVEASILHNTQLVEQAIVDRQIAERRSAQLAKQLADLREAVMLAVKGGSTNKRAMQALELTLAATPNPPEASQPIPDAPAEPLVVEPLEPVPSDTTTAPAPVGSSATPTAGPPTAPVNLPERPTGKKQGNKKAAPSNDAAAGQADLPDTPSDSLPQRSSGWLAAVKLAESGRFPGAKIPGADTVPEPTKAADDASDADLEGEPSGTKKLTVRTFKPEDGSLMTESTVTVTEEGVLDVRKDEQTHTYDLYDTHTDITIKGEPATDEWVVEFNTDEAGAVQVDKSMVDPEAFQREVLRWRPDMAG
ncbi:LigA [Nocardioidaceae bacterium Broad-1]|nr:LigA [Nocardioidaceae bacterium Broad-1]